MKVPTIDFDQPTLLISSIGTPNKFDNSTIYLTSKSINVEKVLLVKDIEKVDQIELKGVSNKIREYFNYLNIEVNFEEISIENYTIESLFLYKSLSELLEPNMQIVVDCNSGPRYFRPIIFDSVFLLKNLIRELFKHKISIYEAIKLEGRKKIIYYPILKQRGISGPLFKVLQNVQNGASEHEIGVNSGIRQSTVSSHLNQLRKLNLIEGGGLKSRKKTDKGLIIEETIKKIWNKFYLEKEIEEEN